MCYSKKYLKAEAEFVGSEILKAFYAAEGEEKEALRKAILDRREYFKRLRFLHQGIYPNE